MAASHHPSQARQSIHPSSRKNRCRQSLSLMQKTSQQSEGQNNAKEGNFKTPCERLAKKKKIPLKKITGQAKCRRKRNGNSPRPESSCPLS